MPVQAGRVRPGDCSFIIFVIVACSSIGVCNEAYDTTKTATTKDKITKLCSRAASSKSQADSTLASCARGRPGRRSAYFVFAVFGFRLNFQGSAASANLKTKVAASKGKAGSTVASCCA